MTTQPPNISDKLAHLLRLAEDGSGATEHERNAAMHAAQKLAFKYALDLDAIDTAAGQERSAVESEYVDDMESWEGSLLSAVARVNFCRVFRYRGGRTSQWHIYGRPEFINVARAQFVYLREQVQRDASAAVKSRDKRAQYARMVVEGFGASVGKYDIDEALDFLLAFDYNLRGQVGLDLIKQHTGLTDSYASEIRPFIKRREIAPEIVENMGVWGNSFREFMVSEISRRLRAEYRKLVEDEGDNAQALVRNEEAGVDEFAASLGLSKSARSERKWDGAGARAGTEAGKNATLQRRASLDSSRKELGA